MKKHKVLAAVDRRMDECRKMMDNPETPSSMKSRAGGAWHALLLLKIEIEDMDTKKEGRDYPPCI